MTPRHPADWIALSLLPGLGPISLNRLLERYPNPHEIAFDLPAHVVSAGTRGASAAAIRSARRNLRRRVDEELRRAGRAGVRILTRDSADYPAALLEIPDPPILLYLRGTLAQDRPRVAVVGSRAATRHPRARPFPPKEDAGRGPGPPAPGRSPRRRGPPAGPPAPGRSGRCGRIVPPRGGPQCGAARG